MAWIFVRVVPGLLAAFAVVLGMVTLRPTPTYAGPSVHYHQVPCSWAPPDKLAIDWHLTWRIPSAHHSSGKRTTTNKRTVTALFRRICSVTLVIYDPPIVTSCPAGVGIATYHLTFSRSRTVSLVVTEQQDGCTNLWVEGHRKLGYSVGVLILPRGIPVLWLPRIPSGFPTPYHH